MGEVKTRRQQAEAFVEEHRPLVENDPSMDVLARIIVQGAKLAEEIAEAHKRQADIGVESANRYAAALNDPKTPAKDIAKLQASHDHNHRCFVEIDAALTHLDNFMVHVQSMYNARQLAQNDEEWREAAWDEQEWEYVVEDSETYLPPDRPWWKKLLKIP